MVQAGWDCKVGTAQCPPRLFSLSHLSPLYLFIHKGQSYLQSISCKAFSILRGPRWNGIHPSLLLGSLAMLCFLFWQPHHPRLPGQFSLRFYEVIVSGLPFPSQHLPLAWCLSILPQGTWESVEVNCGTDIPFWGQEGNWTLGVC